MLIHRHDEPLTHSRHLCSLCFVPFVIFVALFLSGLFYAARMKSRRLRLLLLLLPLVVTLHGQERPMYRDASRLWISASPISSDV